MNPNITSGVVTGVLSLAAGLASFLLHKPALATYLSDPTTVAAVMALVSGVSGIVAGVLKGLKS